MTTAVLGSFLQDLNHPQVLTYATGLPASAELYLKGASAFAGYSLPAVSLADTTGHHQMSSLYDTSMLQMHAPSAASAAALAGHHIITDPTQQMMAAGADPNSHHAMASLAALQQHQQQQQQQPQLHDLEQVCI